MVLFIWTFNLYALLCNFSSINAQITSLDLYANISISKVVEIVYLSGARATTTIHQYDASFDFSAVPSDPIFNLDKWAHFSSNLGRENVVVSNKTPVRNSQYGTWTLLAYIHYEESENQVVSTEKMIPEEYKVEVAFGKGHKVCSS